MFKKIYTKDELNAMDIFTLRALGREVGVIAPTKLPKIALIEQILRISAGEAPPEPPRRGRPPKQDFVRDTASGAESQEQNSQASSYTRLEYQPRIFVKPEAEVGVLKEEPPRGIGEDEEREGILEVHPDGYGFLRVKNFEYNEKDAYVNAVKLKKLGLRDGDYVKGIARTVQEGKPAALHTVISVNGIPYEELGRRPNFDDLIPIYPNERLKLENAGANEQLAIRAIDLVAPIGKGQRAMIVSPPKAGKTTLLKMIAQSIAQNYPEVELKVLLIDERPEEVTDMQRSIKGEVIYSTFDETPEHHTKAAELLLSRSKRLVEMGKDVVILLDSLTRLARAYNLTIPPTGRTLTGGIDPGALHNPKRFFGSARNIENGGSLTIIATALIDTGSRMDDVIYEEFKGTGNMEIHLDRRLSEKRIFPAIDLAKSSTRKEELLLTPSELEAIWAIRKILATGDTAESIETLYNMMLKTSSNKELVEQLNQQMAAYQKSGFTFRKMS